MGPTFSGMVLLDSFCEPCSESPASDLNYSACQHRVKYFSELFLIMHTVHVFSFTCFTWFQNHTLFELQLYLLNCVTFNIWDIIFKVV